MTKVSGMQGASCAATFQGTSDESSETGDERRLREPRSVQEWFFPRRDARDEKTPRAKVPLFESTRSMRRGERDGINSGTGWSVPRFMNGPFWNIRRKQRENSKWISSFVSQKLTTDSEFRRIFARNIGRGTGMLWLSSRVSFSFTYLFVVKGKESKNSVFLNSI